MTVSREVYINGIVSIINKLSDKIVLNPGGIIKELFTNESLILTPVYLIDHQWYILIDKRHFIGKGDNFNK